jgi:hypothetical protein
MHFAFTIHMTDSIFLNIITNSLCTSEHYIVVAADLGDMLKSAFHKTSAILRAKTK